MIILKMQKKRQNKKNQSIFLCFIFLKLRTEVPMTPVVSVELRSHQAFDRSEFFDTCHLVSRGRESRGPRSIQLCEDEKTLPVIRYFVHLVRSLDDTTSIRPLTTGPLDNSPPGSLIALTLPCYLELCSLCLVLYNLLYGYHNPDT